MGTVGGMDVGCKFLYDGSTPSDEGPRPMFVLDAHHTLVVVTFFSSWVCDIIICGL